MNNTIPSQPLSQGGVLHTPPPAFTVALRLADEISKLDLGSITKERVAMVNIIRNEIEQDRRNAYASNQAKIAALVGALEDMVQAVRMMTEEEQYQFSQDAFSAAVSALQQAKQGGES